MSKKVNTTSIGLFIVAGLALGVIGLLLLSSSRMFAKTHEVIVYFDESLNGLSQGAPVKFRGVTIGSVKRVMVRYNQAANDFAMPVIFEVEERLLRERMPDSQYIFTPSTLKGRIAAGMRATLESESLVTGVLYVSIDVHEGAQPPEFHQLQPLYPELPSKPTQMQQLFQNLASLDVKAMQTNLNNLILTLDSTVGRLNMAQINRNITNLLESVNRLVSDPDITNGIAGIRPTLDQYRELGARLTSKVDPLADGITNALAEASLTLAQIRGAGENLKLMLAPNSPVQNELNLALEHLAAAGQSISALADFLKEHPNALLVGRKSTNKKP